MDDFKSTLRGLFDIGWTKHRTDAHWFKLAWEDKVTTVIKTIYLVRLLLDRKEDATNRLDNATVQQIFDEEIATFQKRIEGQVSDESDAHRGTEPVSQIPFASVRQEPVGHGGFHTGVLGTRTPLFRWVYDCGSWKKTDVLKERVDDFAKRLQREPRRTDIDLLFVSHFDADHTSGLDYLLDQERKPRLRVHTVVIPYVSPAIAFSILAKSVVNETCTDELIGIVCSPALHFASRGVKRLIIYKPKKDRHDGWEGRAPSPAPPRGTAPGPKSQDSLKPIFVGLDGKRLLARKDLASGISVAEAEFGTVCGIAADGVWTDWWLLPYAYEWAVNREKLRELAKKTIGLDPDHPGFNKRLAKELRTKEGVKRTKSIFSHLNSNETSLSLYAGPGSQTDVRCVYGSAPNAKPAGWLLTGDAKLKSKVRLKEWHDCFRQAFSFTGHLMLPHHGAAGNFNKGLNAYAKDARFFVTVDAADARSGKRPHPGVKVDKDTLDIVSEEGPCLAELSGPTTLNNELWRTKVSQW